MGKGGRFQQLRELFANHTGIPFPECLELLPEHDPDIFFGPLGMPIAFIHGETIPLNVFIVNEVNLRWNWFILTLFPTSASFSDEYCRDYSHCSDCSPNSSITGAFGGTREINSAAIGLISKNL